MRNLLLIGALILLAGCTAQPGPGNASAPGVTTGSSGGAPFDLSACKAKCVKYPTDPGNNTMYISCMDICYKKEGNLKRDPGACDPLLDELNSSTFFGMCVTDVAKTIGSGEPCMKINTDIPKAVCLESLAKQLKDPSLCDRTTYNGSSKVQDAMIKDCKDAVAKVN
ncbi:MAG: hypothetical protein U0R44_04140 [Candidatus Micrarchaeia archaeon]